MLNKNRIITIGVATVWLAGCQAFNYGEQKIVDDPSPTLNYTSFSWMPKKKSEIGPITINSSNMILPDGKFLHLLTIRPLGGGRFGANYGQASNDEWFRVVGEFAPSYFCRGRGVNRYTPAYVNNNAKGEVKNVMVECG